MLTPSSVTAFCLGGVVTLILIGGICLALFAIAIACDPLGAPAPSESDRP